MKSFRSRCSRDLEALVAFYNAHAKDLLHSGPLAPISPMSQHGRMVLNQDLAYWLTLRHVLGDEILSAGLVTLRPVGRMIAADIEMIATSPSARGRGLGTRLLEELHAWAEARGATVFYLPSTNREDRQSARRRSFALGYKLIEGSERHFVRHVAH